MGNQNDVGRPLARFFISKDMKTLIASVKPKQNPLINNPTYCKSAPIKPNNVAMEHETPINWYSFIVGWVERII